MFCNSLISTSIIIDNLYKHFGSKQFISRSNRWFLTVDKLAKRDNGYVCQLCKQEINSIDEISIDHIVPSSKGGSDALSNKQLAHRKCNSVKSSTENLPPEYFLSPPSKKKKIRKENAFNDQYSNPTYWMTADTDLKDANINWVAELYNEIVKNEFKNLSYARFEKFFQNYAEQVLDKTLKGKS